MEVNFSCKDASARVLHQITSILITQSALTSPHFVENIEFYCFVYPFFLFHVEQQRRRHILTSKNRPLILHVISELISIFNF